MAYAPPSKAAFIAIFPSFAAVTDEAYSFWSGQAAMVTEPMQDCLAARMDLATMRVTAHYLTEAGIGTGTESEIAAQGASGFKSIKSGTISLEMADSNGVDMGTWGTTSYGRQAYPMLKACVAGPRVTGTGTLCGGHPWAY